MTIEQHINVVQAAMNRNEFRLEVASSVAALIDELEKTASGEKPNPQLQQLLAEVQKRRQQLGAIQLILGA